MQKKYAGFGAVNPVVKLEFYELGLTLKNGTKVLDGVTGGYRGNEEMILEMILSSMLMACIPHSITGLHAAYDNMIGGQLHCNLAASRPSHKATTLFKCTTVYNIG